MKKSRLLIAGSAISVALLSAAPSYAQEVKSDDLATLPKEGVKAENSEAIVVTGSRIRRDTFSTIEPITVVTAQEITQGGFNSAGDVLQSQAVTAGADQINNIYGAQNVAGGTGVNTLGLRNLGPARTLVLLNGRRLGPSGTRGNVVATDLNVLPTAIVDRIEVLKTGASSIYGSDAIAGVVNIMTDSKLRGVSVAAQVNVPEVGAGIDRRISTTFGFGDDRLNVIGSVEYRNREALRRSDRDFTSCPIPGYKLDAASPMGSDDPYPLGDPRNCFTTDNGGMTINTLGLPRRSAIGRTSGQSARFRRFVPAPGVGGDTPGYLGVGTYDRDSFDPAMQQRELITPVENYTGFLAGAYQTEFLGNAEIYGEVVATRRKSAAKIYRSLALDYLQDSPLLPVAFRSGDFEAPNAVSSGKRVAARAYIGFGLTDSSQVVDYVRAGAGVRGDFAFDGWRYNAYVGKSWTDGTYDLESFLIDRLANSMNVVETSPGVFSCASAASNPGCVPGPQLSADVIGGKLPQAFRDYILVNTIGYTTFRESTASFNIDGPLFSLPDGDVQLALGAEYRKQRIDDTPDENAISGNLYDLSGSIPTRGTDNVKEVFGEIFVPIMTDRPLLQNLSLSASGRYTDYASYGSDTTYKLAGEWEVFKGVGIRGSYGTSFRAPALAEQYLGATNGFISADYDPCDSGNFPISNGSPDVAAYTPVDQRIAANCKSIGIDTNSFVQDSNIAAFRRGGAETGLSAETSRNWSVGAVVQPRISSSTTLAFAVDYFDIKISNGVTSLSAGSILSRCYSDPEFDVAKGFCRFVTRGNTNQLSVTSGFVNIATDIAKGFEFTGKFATDLLGGRVMFNASVTKNTEQAEKTFPEEFLLNTSGTTNNPDWLGNFDVTYRTGPAAFRYAVAWSNSSSGTAKYQATSDTTGVTDEDYLKTLNNEYQLEVPDYFQHSASVQLSLTDKFQMTFGVRNLLDKDPPKITAYYDTIGNAPRYSVYDYTGRQWFMNTNFKF